MGDTRNKPCAACGRSAPAEAMVEVDSEHYQCETCHERVLQDYLIPERAPVADNTPTRPTGDPGEAGHGQGAAA